MNTQQMTQLQQAPASSTELQLDTRLTREAAELLARIDALGVVRAAASNLIGGGKKQGASTITQQVAKNFFLTSERSFSRKISEILLALQIERELSKDEILELYLNRVYFGGGAYGIEAAANASSA